MELFKGFYVGLMLIPNIFIPALIGSSIFLLLRPNINFTKTTRGVIYQQIILFIIFILCLYIWAIIDSLIFKTLTLENVKKDFNSQFAGFIPIVAIFSVSIPLLYLRLLKKEKLRTTHR
tara:strand:+ start:144 stop:500 length:357 start_codon:yes stop_codon:yes gene_type:complete